MERRQLALKDLDATVADARCLLDQGYRRAGEWDLAQVCGHCVYAIRGALDGFDAKPPVYIKIMARLLGMKKKMFATRRIKAGLPAPASSVVASAQGDREAERRAVEELAAAVDRVQRHTGACQPHPVFGLLSSAEWLEFLTIHTMHHLTFLVPRPGKGDRSPQPEETTDARQGSYA